MSFIFKWKEGQAKDCQGWAWSADSLCMVIGDHPKKRGRRTIAEEMELSTSKLEREKKARWKLAEKKPWRNGRRGSTGLAKTALIMLVA